jgi:hypothetical protein
MLQECLQVQTRPADPLRRRYKTDLVSPNGLATLFLLVFFKLLPQLRL